MHQIVSAMKEAVDTIPAWDSYADGKYPIPWDGETFADSSLYRSKYELELIRQGKLQPIF